MNFVVEAGYSCVELSFVVSDVNKFLLFGNCAEYNQPVTKRTFRVGKCSQPGRLLIQITANIAATWSFETHCKDGILVVTCYLFLTGIPLLDIVHTILSKEPMNYIQCRVPVIHPASSPVKFPMLYSSYTSG